MNVSVPRTYRKMNGRSQSIISWLGSAIGSLPFLGIVLLLYGTSPAIAQLLAPVPGAAPQGAAAPASAQQLKKAQALQATIAALAANGSDAAWDSLKKIVTGDTDMKELDPLATQQALMLWLARGTPESDAFVMEVLCNTEQVRPAGKGAYTASALRDDLAQGLAHTASLSFRTALAERYLDPATSEDVRRAIVTVLKEPLPENIPLQIKLLSASTGDASLKTELTGAVAEANAKLVQQALGIELEGTVSSPLQGQPPGMADASQKFGGPPGAGNIPPGFGGPPGMPLPPGGVIPPVDSLPGAKMGRGLFGALQRVFGSDPPGSRSGGTPSDGGDLTKTLWSAEFATSLSKQVADEKSDRARLLGFLASIPSQAGRSELKKYLEGHWSEGPADLAGATKTSSPGVDSPFGGNPGALAGKPGGTNQIGLGRRGKEDDDQPPPQAAAVPDIPARPEIRISNFGENWFDPGALVVLKSFPYQERPQEKPNRRLNTLPPNAFSGAGNPAAAGNAKLSPAAQRREDARLAREKLLEARYDWRDAIIRYVQLQNERFAANGKEPAESTESTAEEPAEIDVKPLKPAASSALSRPVIGSKTKAAEPVKGPHELPFPLHAGAKVVKEFHNQWPTSGGPGREITDPMKIWYFRTEEEGSYAKAVSHYRGAVKGKSSTVREIEDGRWVDVTQEEEKPDRVRSIDVFITHTPSDSTDRKASKDEPLVVEVLVVEIPKVAAAAGDEKAGKSK